MIRIIARGIASLLLEIASAILTVALVLLVMSAYITSRIVGVSLPTNKVAMATKVGRDALAMILSMRRNAAIAARSDQTGLVADIDDSPPSGS
jgi:hypothetical protein